MCAAQLECEGDPSCLPPDIRERDYKSHVVGASVNAVRKLVHVEQFRQPATVRVVTWSPLLRSLKGCDKAVFADLGGAVAEVRVWVHERRACVSWELCHGV